MWPSPPTPTLTSSPSWRDGPRLTSGRYFHNLTLSKLHVLDNSVFRLSSCNPDVEGPQVESLGEVIRNIASEALRCTQLDLK